MSASGTIRLKLVWAMLEKCAPGFRVKEQVHNWRVTFNGRTYPNLQRGKKGDKNPEVFMGHVRQMARQLLIQDCAAKELPDAFR